MSVLYIMIPVAFILAGLAVVGFIAAARSGQYDDVDTPASRMLFEDSSNFEKKSPREIDRFLSLIDHSWFKESTPGRTRTCDLRRI